jgi:hypothetical protein
MLDRAVKHWIIAAALGDDGSLLDALKEGYKWGLIKKEDFAAALRAHQAAVDATKKSPKGGKRGSAAKVDGGMLKAARQK